MLSTWWSLWRWPWSPGWAMSVRLLHCKLLFFIAPSISPLWQEVMTHPHGGVGHEAPSPWGQRDSISYWDSSVWEICLPICSFIQSFISVGAQIFILHFGWESNLHFLFCCSNCFSCGHWAPFQLAPGSPWHTPWLIVCVCVISPEPQFLWLENAHRDLYVWCAHCQLFFKEIIHKEKRFLHLPLFLLLPVFLISFYRSVFLHILFLLPEEFSSAFFCNVAFVCLKKSLFHFSLWQIFSLSVEFWVDSFFFQCINVIPLLPVLHSLYRKSAVITIYYFFSPLRIWWNCLGS